MKSFSPPSIRNVALVGHGGAGKTSLAEAMLFCAGAINRQGRVEDGNTTTDFDPEEVKRGISLALSLAPFEFENHKINLLDAPGYADFVTELETALDVADLAIIVVSGVEGVEVQTEVAWRLAAERGLPRMFFVNKLDRERASFERTLEQLRERFGAGVAPLELPIGEEASFRGIADLLTDSAVFYEGGKATKGEIPDEMTEREHEVRDNLVEGIVVADDDLTERYLEGEFISPAELEKALAQGVAEASVFPVTCGSATKVIGIDRLSQLICEVGPSPLDRPPVTVCRRRHRRGHPRPRGPAPRPRLPHDRRPLRGQGVVPQGAVGHHPARCRAHQPPSATPTSACTACSPCGARSRCRSTTCRRATWGRCAKLSDTSTGDTLAPKGTPVTVPATEPPVPVLSVAILPKSKGDEDKLHDGPPPPPGRGPGLVHPPRRRDPPDDPVGDGRDPPVDRHRAPAPQVRRRGADGGREGRLPGDDHRRTPRPRASTRSRRAGTGSSASPSCGSSPSSGAAASSSSTRSWAGPSPASSSPRSRRAWPRPW